MISFTCTVRACFEVAGSLLCCPLKWNVCVTMCFSVHIMDFQLFWHFMLLVLGELKMEILFYGDEISTYNLISVICRITQDGKYYYPILFLDELSFRLKDLQVGFCSGLFIQHILALALLSDFLRSLSVNCVQYPTVHFLYLQCICLYHTCMLKKEFGYVWLLTTRVYLLKLLYVNSSMVGGCMAWNLFILPIVCVYTFFCSFLMAYCALDLARDHAP